MIKLLISVFLILFFNLAGARNIYVDGVRGSDAQGVPGTLDNPYRTISHASGFAFAGDTIYIRRGTYRERAWINNSGSAGRPIVITAYQNEEVIISGADRITTRWIRESSNSSGSIWKTVMPFTRNGAPNSIHEAGMDQVFVDGAMQVEARWPNIPANTNPATIDASTYATAVTGALLGGPYGDDEPALAQYTSTQAPSVNLLGAYVHFIPGARWASATGKITARSGNKFTFQYNYKAERQGHVFYRPRNGDIFYLWGKYELLDAPGEWFRKPDNGGTLYLCLPNGQDPNNSLVEVKSAGDMREYAFWIFDRSYITIKNIKIRAARILITSSCSNITIDGVDVKHSSHYSIVPGWYGTNGVGSIATGARNSIVTNCTVAYNVEGGISIGGNNSKAINNVVHDTGYIGNAGSSLSCSGDDMELKNNTAWGTGSANILDFRHSKRSKIWYNDAAESGKITFDGGILMAARKRDPNILFDAEGTEVAYNYIHNGLGLTGGDFYGTSGIYFEGDVDDYLVHHNVIWNASVGINIPNDYVDPITRDIEQNRDIKIYNNTFYNTPIVIRGNDMIGTELKNNTFSRFGGTFNNDIPIRNNLSTDQDYSSIHASNIYAPNPRYSAPLNQNFIPAAGSPLIDGGTPLGRFTNGFLDLAPDIGAFESGGPAFVAGALVRLQDVANITVTYDNAPVFANKRFTVSGLPEGRKIGSDFKLKIGTAPSGGIMQYDYATNQVSFINVPKGNLTGVQPIFLDMGTDGIQQTNSNIDLSNLSIYSIAVYPNPSKGEFFIRIPQEYQDKEIKIRVYALDGKIILDATLNNNNADAVKLTTRGIYILKTTIEDQTFTNKIFVN